MCHDLCAAPEYRGGSDSMRLHNRAGGGAGGGKRENGEPPHTEATHGPQGMGFVGGSGCVPAPISGLEIVEGTAQSLLRIF